MHAITEALLVNTRFWIKLSKHWNLKYLHGKKLNLSNVLLLFLKQLPDGLILLDKQLPPCFDGLILPFLNFATSNV